MLASGFLLRQGFRMELPFEYGVPYLSREEMIRAIAMEKTKRDTTRIPDVILRDDDTVHRDFLKVCRRTIRDWHNMKVSTTASTLLDRFCQDLS